MMTRSAEKYRRCLFFGLQWTGTLTLLVTVAFADESADELVAESPLAAVISDSGVLSPGARVALPNITTITTNATVDDVKSQPVALTPPVRIAATPEAIRLRDIQLVQHTSSGGSGQRNSTSLRPNGNNAAQAAAKAPASFASMTLQEQIAALLATNAKRGISTASCEPFDLICFAMAPGAEAMVFQPSNTPDSRDKDAKGSFVYSIGSLCWNYPCAGKTLLRTDGRNVYARIGRGYQAKPSQFLAMLAMANIKEDYEIRVDAQQFAIAHLIKTEREACQRGQDLSLTLVALSFYGSSRETWTNVFDEKWSIDAMVTEELNRPVDQGSSDATDWLMGLSAAVQLYSDEKVKLTGALALAEEQVRAYHAFTLSVQNEQGLWHPQFFMFRGVGGDLYDSLLTGGHIVRFLAFSLPDNEIRDPRMNRAIESLVAALSRVPATANAANLNDHQVEAVSIATQALTFYQARTQ